MVKTLSIQAPVAGLGLELGKLEANIYLLMQWCDPFIFFFLDLAKVFWLGSYSLRI
jgi:hypothetical protein